MQFKITFLGFESEDDYVETKEFEDSFKPFIYAREWAEDYAYQLSNKGDYIIEEIKNES